MPRKILWLPSWYPNQLQPFDGDFIQRHAAAVSLNEKIDVIFFVRDKEGSITRNILKQDFEKGQLRETIVYYYAGNKRSGLVSKLFAAKRFQKIYQKVIKDYLEKNGLPDLVHVHTGMKAGLIALWLKKKKNLSYLLTEHWTGFVDSQGDNFEALPFYVRQLWKKVVDNATAVSTVSNFLKEAVRKRFVHSKISVIPNVVNTNIFHPDHNAFPAKAYFVHISGMDERKNPGEILKAFRLVLQKYPDATMDMYGCTHPEIISEKDQLNLGNAVRIYSEVPQEQLATQLQKATALILYSSVETFGCVVIEANACGTPVIAGDIPVMHEIINAGKNGTFATLSNPAALADAMIQMIENNNFDRSMIASSTSQNYSYQVIANRFSNWYTENGF